MAGGSGAPGGADGAPDRVANPAASAVRLVLVIAAVVAVGFAAGVGETVLLVGALLLCIVAHEFGHFATAKLGGMKVTEFFVGFGPRLWSVRRGETEYGVKAIPAGGYCKIIGMTGLEEVDPADEARTYRSRPVVNRLAVAVAGSAMHFLIAVVVLFCMFFFTGDDGNYLTPPPLPPSAKIVNVDALTTPAGATIASPAQQAGIRPGDRITAIDGRHFATWDDQVTYVKAHPGVPLTLDVDRGGHQVVLHATPANLEVVQPAGAAGAGMPAVTRPTGFLGIEIDPYVTVHSGLGASISDAGGAWVHISALTLHALGHLVTFHGVSAYVHNLTSQRAANSAAGQGVRFASPVKVVQLFNEAGHTGFGQVLWLLAVVNLSLGIFNLVPLLPLDGGHVVIAAYEGVRSRLAGRPYRADVAKMAPIAYVALAVIVFIGLSSLFLDIRDLVG
ncbi:MAG TPA: M50 family metallopeptidase [Acidimicrobiales bacterium]|nr:M50 family metallopeptidase [Acidimicrobiales bacterium]